MEIKSESSYSRIYQHTQDDKTFAIIGSQDKDTRKSRYNELCNLVRKLSRNKPRIGFNEVDGTYTYDNGEIGFEDSLIIYNITKEDALDIAKAINQETIVWKDKDFIGLIYMDGSVCVQFDNIEGKNMSFSNATNVGYGTKLKKDKSNNSPYGFTFEGIIKYPKNIKSKNSNPTYEGFTFSKK